MPVWAWVIVTLLAGIGSGLLGTLVKISHDRQAEVRRQALIASQEFALLAPKWFAAVNEAITARSNDYAVPPEESEPVYQAAVASLRDAQGSLNRLLVALPQRSAAARKAIAVVEFLDAAVAEIDVWPLSEREEGQDIDDPPEDWTEEEEDSFQAEAADEPIAEATMWRGFAEQALGGFIYEAAGELRAGVGAELRRGGRKFVFVAKTPYRVVKQRRVARARRERDAAFQARMAQLRELRERQAGAPREQGE
jgi:hypothetical protein